MSGLTERAGRTVRTLLSEVSGAKPSRAEQRREGEGDQPQGERHGAAEEREPGEEKKTKHTRTRKSDGAVFHL